jgi:3-methylcrotonyl-CoA carboxylase alpha subunit
MFSSLLIANRGEIACRIIRTARRLGVRTIAVYSDADRGAMHVADADEAHALGPPEARLSYLNGARILEIARAAGAEAIHPGYGFLSENAEFAEACAKHAIVFVGPTPRAIRRMGLKDEAKAVARTAGVPVVPGYQGGEQSLERLMKESAAVGFPVIIKAVAGGGGRGMRAVGRPEDFASALEACRREARAAFGDDRVLLEKYFAVARHVEVQVMADAHGNVIHLFERDCSIQRRHQKIIEEAPAPDIPAAVRAKMLEAAVAIARSVDYRNAGTVEFLYEPQHGRFFFMEMNTRLQVEHPVTEMITGLDLVELQLLVANGEKLPVSQPQVEANGHAVEARLYAEDPAQGFLPQTGRVHEVVWPTDIANCRIDTGIEKGSEIGSYYDSMIAKIITWGPGRNDAIEKLRVALDRTLLFGLKTNKAFLLSVARDSHFRREAPTTQFLEHFGDEASRPLQSLVAMGCAAWLFISNGNGGGPWSDMAGWTLSGAPRLARCKLSVQGRMLDLLVRFDGRLLLLSFGNERHTAESLSIERNSLKLLIDGVPAALSFHRWGPQLFIDVSGNHLTISEPEFSSGASAGPAEGSVRAPMPGRVLRLEIAQGTPVRSGDRLLLLEAMKMEHVLRAPVAGTLSDLLVAEGDQVREGDVLCVIVPEHE